MSKVLEILFEIKEISKTGYASVFYKDEVLKRVNEALAELEKSPRELDFAINCGAMAKGDDSCCGCLYWSDDGKILCNECGSEYEIIPIGQSAKLQSEVERLKEKIKIIQIGDIKPPEFTPTTPVLRLDLCKPENAFLYGWEAAIVECGEILSKVLKGGGQAEAKGDLNNKTVRQPGTES